ncbi:MAG: Crp/Fnr family transcriptional regulator [Bacteroidota bacterium]
MASNLKYWYLHDHKLFRNLNFAEINALCILKRFKKSKRNEILDLPFSEKERIYFLKKGTIKLIKIEENGEETVVDVLKKGDLFGDLNFEKNEDSNEYFKVLSEEAILCTFFRESLEEIMLKKPNFALKYIKFIGFRYKKVQNNYRNLLFKDAKTRLLMLLDMLMEEKEQTILPNYLTQKDFAQLTCTSRQTVVRLFKELEEENILRYTQKEIEILDMEKIKSLVL